MANQNVNKELRLIKEWCKGCSICAEYCPVNVLELINDKIHIKDANQCIKCGLCELRCPDYAIYIEEDNNEK